MQFKMHSIEHFQNMLHDRTDFFSTSSPAQIEKFFDSNPHLKEVFIGENGELTHTLEYKAKVKLHGTYGGINIDFKHNQIFPQSRERQLTIDKPDSYGFYNWVMQDLGGEKFTEVLKNNIKSNKDWRFYSLSKSISNLVIHGEWAGPNIYYGVSSGLVKKDFYSVFAVEVFTDHPYDCIVITDPKDISELLDRDEFKSDANTDNIVNCYNTPFYVIPYYEIGNLGQLQEWMRTVDLLDLDSLKRFTTECNVIVDETGKEDLFIKRNFGISGVGEGLVFYPYKIQKYGKNLFKNEHMDDLRSDQIFKYMFKAKNKAHQSIKTAKPVIVTPEQQENLDKLIANTCTEARLNQFLLKLDQPPTQKMMGQFLKSFGQDVAKECRLEIEQFGDNKKLVMKKINDKAANWFKSKIK